MRHGFQQRRGMGAGQSVDNSLARVFPEHSRLRTHNSLSQRDLAAVEGLDGAAVRGVAVDEGGEGCLADGTMLRHDDPRHMFTARRCGPRSVISIPTGPERDQTLDVPQPVLRHATTRNIGNRGDQFVNRMFPGFFIEQHGNDRQGPIRGLVDEVGLEVRVVPRDRVLSGGMEVQFDELVLNPAVGHQATGFGEHLESPVEVNESETVLVVAQCQIAAPAGNCLTYVNG